ncbi:ABC transporter permease [Stackebrandtia nassauensis]|uniref:Binding-protein-dependent transport systems inner membrane component n=1 Tax=Stackebrandtia nassauensis (strain DSM 44728 / CIP 108903 / NRRL B-16338 / NBRC 102104 / LLR-40K-21) TaxID=446470 RepID=D3Q3H8_STANL|nr:ABC transporter permease subunit [Stackebrandtia nassauensis]ADD42019.1 binding-protein-dependent transport systems inner membrane component [Stackebrandtia nassauensis DSM 44728]
MTTQTKPPGRLTVAWRPIRTLLWRLLLWFGLPVALLTIWWLASDGSRDFYWPSLRDILHTFTQLWTLDRWRADILPSLARLAAGYAAASALGIALGVLIGLNWRIRALCEPVLEFFRAVPPPVLVPVIMLFTGVGDTMKAVVIVSGCVWPILLNTVTGVRGIDPVQRDTCAVFALRPLTRLRRLVLPAAAPHIATGMRQALSIGIILMVVSEMFAAHSGLGFAIVQFQRGFQIPEMWSGIILLGLIGVTLSLLFTVVERRVLAWYHGMRRTEGTRT